MSFGIPVRNGLAIGLLSSTTLSSNGGLFPAMFLDFLQPFLDSRVTFSRGSNATLVDSTGKITYAPANLLTFSEQFDNAAWGKGSATVVADSTVAPDGTTTADTLVSANATASTFVQQTITAAAANYTFSVYVKANGARYVQLLWAGSNSTNIANFDLNTGTVTAGTNLGATITNTGNSWYRISITSALAAAAGAVNVYLVDAGNAARAASYTGNGTSGIFIWGAQLEPVTYQTTPSTYNATTTAAYYGPRFDYDPVTLAAKGLLIEEQRTNLLTGSADFTATYWPVATNVVVTADNTTSPDGTTNADRLADNTTAGVQHRIYRDYTFTAASHTLSVFAKRNDHRWLRLFFFDGTTSFFGNFDLLNGVVGNKQASTTTTITAFGNGWYRCTMTATTAAAAGNIQLVMLPTDDTAVPVLYTGTGTSLWLFGAQLEAGAFATSYIPTVASQVTRSADIASMTGTNFSSWYNQSAGTFVFEGDSGSLISYPYAVLASDGSFDNRFGIYRSLSSVAGLVVSSGATQMDISASSVVANVPFKVAVSAQANNGNLSLNGGIGTNDTSITMPTVNRLSLASGPSGGADQLNGHIRSIAYYNTRLSNTQLQTLTAPPLVTTLSLDFTNGIYDA
jgi:hypothetical protein